MRKVLLAALVVVLLIGAGAGFYVHRALDRPIPPVDATSSFPSSRAVEGQPPALPWPSQGSAAVSVPQIGVVGTSGDRGPRPIASIAKVMTAYVVLQDHPLNPGDQGPSTTVTPEDVATYERGISRGESTVPVVAGEQISELQMLQALLIPSGNNIADLLARWDAGSRDAFVAKMNAKAAELGMTSTHYDDASGFSPKTVSTPSDLILLGAAAMQNPVFAEVVAEREATVPVAGRVFNVNTSLGKDGNVGIKTGSTPEAGSCLLFAAKRTVAGQEMLIVGAVLDQELLEDAFQKSDALAVATGNGPRTARVLSASEVVGTYTAPWGATTDVVPSDDVDLLAWPGMETHLTVQMDQVEAPTPSGTKVGTLTAQLGEQSKTVDLVTTAPLPGPDQNWRLLAPLRDRGLVK